MVSPDSFGENKVLGCLMPSSLYLTAHQPAKLTRSSNSQHPTSIRHRERLSTTTGIKQKEKLIQFF